MRLIDVWDFFVHSSLHYAFAGTSLAFVGSSVLNFNMPLIHYFIIFSMFFFIAAFNRYVDSKEDEINDPERVNFLKNKNFAIVSLSIVFLLLSALILFYLRNYLLIEIFSAAFFISYFYNKKLFIVSKKLKELFVIKNVSIALLIVLLGVVYPYVLSNASDFAFLAIISSFFFTRMFINTVTFDIKDIDGDKHAGVMTIPVALGEEKSRYYLNFCNVLSGLILVVWFILEPHSQYLLLLFLPVLMASFYINLQSKKFRRTLQYELLVDGSELYLLAFVVFLARVYGVV